MAKPHLYQVWYQQTFAEGEARGRVEGAARGRLAGEASSLLTVLDARGIELSLEQEILVCVCRDSGLLQSWLRRAATASTFAQVFGDQLKLERDHPCWAPDPETREQLLATRELYEQARQQVIAGGEARGRIEGEAHGRMEGELESLLALLDSRGLTLSAEQSARVRGCQDAAQLETWLRRAATATATGQVFE